MTDTEDTISSGLIEVELARTRAMAAMIDGATPYLGIVEAVSADGRSVNVRRADEAPGVNRWVGRQGGARPAIGSTIPILPITGINARGQLESAPFALPQVGGDVTGGFVVDGLLGVINSAGIAGIEFGRAGVGDTPHIDFHAQGGANDFDVRLIVTGGGADPGQGILNVQAGLIVRYGAWVWDDASAAGRVLAGHIVDRQIITSKIALEAVGTDELAAGSVTNQKLAAGSVSVDKVLDGHIIPQKLDRAYSTPGHVHDERYSGLGHGHDERYTLHGHGHGYLPLGGGVVGSIQVNGTTTANGTFWQVNGEVGFFGVGTVTRRGAPAGLATDGTATSATIANAVNVLRAGLIQLGLFG